MDIAELRQDRFGVLKIHSGVSFMKAGILFSEIISTVSETYAHEILTT